MKRPSSSFKGGGFSVVGAGDEGATICGDGRYASAGRGLCARRENAESVRRMKKITDFRPQEQNANKHNPFGMRLLEKSLRQDGFIDAMTAAADGEIISGSSRIEKAVEIFTDENGNDVEPIIVHSDGTRPIILVRDDIPNAKHARAKRLSVAANQIANANYNPDGALLKEWAAEDKQIREMFSDWEWGKVVVIELSENEAFSKLPNEDRAPFQQMTFTLHDDQAEQVREAIKLAKTAGAFVDTDNENSNGNALARICETYIAEHDNC